MGETSRRVLMSYGVPDRKITVTGSPRHDSLVKASRSEKGWTSARLRVNRAKVVVLFASSYSVGVYEHTSDANSKALNSVKKAVIQASEEVTGICLLVKPHPLENVNDSKRLASGYHNVMFAD